MKEYSKKCYTRQIGVYVIIVAIERQISIIE
jgi:radical SAM superfamily enzyme with C-terminal helix-hairpin-helix motif